MALYFNFFFRNLTPTFEIFQSITRKLFLKNKKEVQIKPQSYDPSHKQNVESSSERTVTKLFRINTLKVNYYVAENATPNK